MSITERDECCLGLGLLVRIGAILVFDKNSREVIDKVGDKVGGEVGQRVGAVRRGQADQLVPKKSKTRVEVPIEIGAPASGIRFVLRIKS